MARDFQTYMSGYQRSSAPWECVIKDTGAKHVDFDDTLMKFNVGKYTMGPFVSDCLVEKFLSKSQFESYALIKNFRHPNVVSVQNFYDDSGYPRFVLSWVDGSFTAWMKKDGAGKMFKSTLKGSHPTGALKHIILDLCSGLEHLFKEQLYPPKIDLQQIYMRLVGHRGVPQILINKGKDATDRKEKLWGDMRKALNELFEKAPGDDIDPIAQKFIDYVGVSDVSRLQRFPLQWEWDYQMKARFLLSVMSVGISLVTAQLGQTIVWPETPNGNLRAPLQDVLDHEKKTRKATYDTKEAYDYIRLCKNVIKHWNTMPSSVKAECATWESFIDKIEKWDPLFWCSLYKAAAGLI